MQSWMVRIPQMIVTRIIGFPARPPQKHMGRQTCLRLTHHVPDAPPRVFGALTRAAEKPHLLAIHLRVIWHRCPGRLVPQQAEADRALVADAGFRSIHGAPDYRTARAALCHWTTGHAHARHPRGGAQTRDGQKCCQAVTAVPCKGLSPDVPTFRPSALCSRAVPRNRCQWQNEQNWSGSA